MQMYKIISERTTQQNEGPYSQGRFTILFPHVTATQAVWWLVRLSFLYYVYGENNLEREKKN
jgi:hypothetical protein